MKEVGEGGGGRPVHRLRTKTALFSGLLHLGPQSAGAAQGGVQLGPKERAGLGWGPVGASSQRRRTLGGRPRDARARPPQRTLPVGRGRIRWERGHRRPSPPPLHAHTRSRSRRRSRKEARSESEQPLVKEKDMHRQLGNLCRWRRAGRARARRIPGSLGACLVACKGIATPGQAVIRLDGVPRPYGDQAPSLSLGSGHSRLFSPGGEPRAGHPAALKTP